VKFCRYLRHEDATTIRCETFQGYHLARTIDTMPITPMQAQSSADCFHPGRLFASVSGEVIGLQPLLHVVDDPSGHSTQVLAFRKAWGSGASRSLRFAVIGNSTPANVPRVTFGLELSQLRRLFGLGAD
jgi:hypothetical protein